MVCATRGVGADPRIPGIAFRRAAALPPGAPALRLGTGERRPRHVFVRWFFRWCAGSHRLFATSSIARPGWFFGRLGCTIVHDHPGLPSDFILAVEYPSGARHDLGFYEWLFTIALIVLLFVIRRRGYPAGVLTGITCVAYAPVRFMLDFLRVGDERFYGLTPGQYFALVLMVVGGWVLVRAVRPPRRRGS